MFVKKDYKTTSLFNFIILVDSAEDTRFFWNSREHRLILTYHKIESFTVFKQFREVEIKTLLFYDLKAMKIKKRL